MYFVPYLDGEDGDSSGQYLQGDGQGSPLHSPRSGVKMADSPPSRGLSPDVSVPYSSDNDNENDVSNDAAEDADRRKLNDLHLSQNLFYQQQQQKQEQHQHQQQQQHEREDNSSSSKNLHINKNEARKREQENQLAASLGPNFLYDDHDLNANLAAAARFPFHPGFLLPATSTSTSAAHLGLPSYTNPILPNHAPASFEPASPSSSPQRPGSPQTSSETGGLYKSEIIFPKLMSSSSYPGNKTATSTTNNNNDSTSNNNTGNSGSSSSMSPSHTLSHKFKSEDESGGTNEGGKSPRNLGIKLDPTPAFSQHLAQGASS